MVCGPTEIERCRWRDGGQPASGKRSHRAGCKQLVSGWDPKVNSSKRTIWICQLSLAVFTPLLNSLLCSFSNSTIYTPVFPTFPEAKLSCPVSAVLPTEHFDYKWPFFLSQCTGRRGFWPSLNRVRHKETVVTGVEFICLLLTEWILNNYLLHAPVLVSQKMPTFPHKQAMWSC